MLGAFSVVSCHMICGQFSKGFGANILLLGANNLLLGARRFCSFSVIFGALATWYSQNQYIWSSKLLQSTCSHEICERGPQSPLFRLVTWSVSGFRVRMAISMVSEHDVQTNHKMATTNETTISGRHYILPTKTTSIERD